MSQAGELWIQTSVLESESWNAHADVCFYAPWEKNHTNSQWQWQKCSSNWSFNKSSLPFVVEFHKH